MTKKPTSTPPKAPEKPFSPPKNVPLIREKQAPAVNMPGTEKGVGRPPAKK
jgi:hypothetical protein